MLTVEKKLRISEKAENVNYPKETLDGVNGICQECASKEVKNFFYRGELFKSKAFNAVRKLKVTQTQILIHRQCYFLISSANSLGYSSLYYEISEVSTPQKPK